MTASQILSLLGSVNTPVRVRLFRILISQCDKLPAISEAASEAIQNLSAHPWGYGHLRELLTLQPLKDLRTAFCARIKTKFLTVISPRFWSELTSPDNHFSKKDYRKTNLGYLKVDQFVSIDLLLTRPSIVELLVDLVVSALSGIVEGKKKYRHFVLGPFMDNVVAVRKGWRKRKDLQAKLTQAILETPPVLVRKSFRDLFASVQSEALVRIFPLQLFLQAKLLSTDDLFGKLIPKLVEAEIQKAEKNPKLITELVKGVFANHWGPSRHQLSVIRAIATTLPEHPLAPAWAFVTEKVQTLAFDELKEGRAAGLQFLLGQWRQFRTDQDFASAVPHQVLWSYDELEQIITAVIRKTIDSKATIAKESPAKYTTMLTHILSALTGIFGIYDKISTSAFNSVFFWLPQDFRDEIVAERLCDPTGKKLYNAELTTQPSAVPLSIALLIGDLGKLAKAVAKRSKSDEFGFEKNVSISFPPLLTQEDRNPEAQTVTVHVFERLLFKQLRAKSSKTAIRAFELYSLFVQKVIRTAVQIPDSKVLPGLASGVHFRFCRHALSRLSSRVQPTALNMFISLSVDAGALFVGLKGRDNFAEALYSQLLARLPYSHRVSPVVPMSVLRTLLQFSHHSALPGIDEVAGVLSGKLIWRIFNELPAKVSLRESPPGTPSFSLELPTADFLGAYKALFDSVSGLRWSGGFLKKMLVNLFNPSVPRPRYLGVCVDPGLLQRRPFVSEPVLPAVPPVVELLNFLKQRIDQYDPEDFTHPTTEFLRQMLDVLKGSLFPSSGETFKSFPNVPTDYEKRHNIQSYENVVRKVSTQLQQFDVHKETALALRGFFGKRSFFRRLLAVDDIFTLLDSVIPYVPLSQEEINARKGKPVPRLFYSMKLRISLYPNSANRARITSYNSRPEPKRYNRFGQRLPVRPPKVYPDGHETWMESLSRKYLGPVIDSDPSKVCNLLRTDGMGLYSLLGLLNAHGKYVPEALPHLGHILRLLLDDLLIKDPRPTPENPKPKKTPTLFSDEDGNLRGEVPPLGNRRWARQGQQLSFGEAKFRSTKALIAYVCDVTSERPAPFDLFSPPLLRLLALSPDELKYIVGDANENHWADYLVRAVLVHADFGDGPKSIDWAKTAGERFQAVFRLLACDVFAGAALDVLQQRISSFESVGQRTAVISGLVSGLSVLPEIPFALKTRTSVVAWSLDPNFVSFELPTFALDYIAARASDAKLHVDIRRTIVSAIVAYFKNLFVRNSGPVLADVLFAALEAQFAPARTALGPTFCQLLRPKFCRQLVQQDPVYRELMPPSSTPLSLLAPQKFGELAMPRRGDWQILYERYVETFIGPSLLSKDEHLLQLVVQVLTKIGLRGGKVSEQVSKFVTKAFADFIPTDASQILVGFQLKFCFVDPHQIYDRMIEGFIGIFGKVRTALDALIGAQLKLMWTNDATFDRTVFNPIRRVFEIFRDCLDEVVVRKKEKEDFPVINSLSKRILPALDVDRPPAIQFAPFASLRWRFALLASDALSRALAAEPGEDAMSHVVDFLLTTVPDVFQFGIPAYLEALFRKNDKHLTPTLIRRLADLPDALSSLHVIHDLLRGPIRNTLDAHRGETEELLPLLWKFGNVDEFFGRPPIAFGVASDGAHRMAAQCFGYSGPVPESDTLRAPHRDARIMKKSVMRAGLESKQDVGYALSLNACASPTSSPPAFLRARQSPPAPSSLSSACQESLDLGGQIEETCYECAAIPPPMPMPGGSMWIQHVLNETAQCCDENIIMDDVGEVAAEKCACEESRPAAQRFGFAGSESDSGSDVESDVESDATSDGGSDSEGL
jgi:hypothetical protein